MFEHEVITKKNIISFTTKSILLNITILCKHKNCGEL